MKTELPSMDLLVIDKKATGKRIKEISQKKGITQMSIACYLDRDKKTISNYYCGESLPRLLDLTKLSWILGTSIDELLVIQGDIKDYNWEDVCIIMDNRKKDEILSEFELTADELFDKAFSKYIGYSNTIDREKNITEIGSSGYCWTEVHGKVVLPGLEKEAIYDFINARNEYERLSGEEFETGENYHIDLGQILVSYLLKETELLDKKNAALKRR